MLKAKTGDKYVLSYENNIDKKELYLCPFCDQKVIFVDATFKIKHFRHFVENNCETEPETKRHLEMKKFIVKKFSLDKENIEVGLGFARPDVYLPNRKIAIEVQHSNITYDKFIERTQNYTDNKIWVLWIFDNLLLKENISALLRKAHELYYGRIYIYDNDTIYSVHLKPLDRYIMPNAFSHHNGYYKTYKNKKEIDKKSILKSEYFFKTSLNEWKENNFLVANLGDRRWWN